MAAFEKPDAFEPSEICFVTRGVTQEEVAAVTAVLSGMLQTESDLRSRPDRGQSAWQRSQRGVRSPIVPGHGAWRSFPD
ncbi:acyl-CoA carboxylase subunit epsilon [Luethyella okanaganae]|uniref:Acyl-CoA carboxylase subunit epsilon n=1 Tax=Luethyella okanaganae TaxID=69372 RepID=A0ABW1VCW1_9MICO